MREIQNIFECKSYTPNKNMNRTCMNEKRCHIFYEVYCNEYERKSKGMIEEIEILRSENNVMRKALETIRIILNAKCNIIANAECVGIINEVLDET